MPLTNVVKRLRHKMASLQSPRTQCCCCAVGVFAALFGIFMLSAGICIVLNADFMEVDTSGLPPDLHNEKGKRVVGIILICVAIGALGLSVTVSVLYFAFCSPKPREDLLEIGAEAQDATGQKSKSGVVKDSRGHLDNSRSDRPNSRDSQGMSSQGSLNSLSRNPRRHPRHHKAHGVYPSHKRGIRPLKGRYRSGLSPHPEEDVDARKSVPDLEQVRSTNQNSSARGDDDNEVPPIIVTDSSFVQTSTPLGKSALDDTMGTDMNESGLSLTQTKRNLINSFPEYPSAETTLTDMDTSEFQSSILTLNSSGYPEVDQSGASDRESPEVKPDVVGGDSKEEIEDEEGNVQIPQTLPFNVEVDNGVDSNDLIQSSPSSVDEQNDLRQRQQQESIASSSISSSSSSSHSSTHPRQKETSNEHHQNQQGDGHEELQSQDDQDQDQHQAHHVLKVKPPPGGIEDSPRNSDANLHQYTNAAFEDNEFSTDGSINAYGTVEERIGKRPQTPPAATESHLVAGLPPSGKKKKKNVSGISNPKTDAHLHLQDDLSGSRSSFNSAFSHDDEDLADMHERMTKLLELNASPDLKKL